MSLFDDQDLFPLFDDYTSSSSENISPEHYPQFFVPDHQSYTVDMTQYSAPEQKPNPNLIDRKKKSKRKIESPMGELEKLLERPDHFSSLEEEKEWKKQKRMIRNRLSAQASREKKSNELDFYKTINENLVSKNDELNKRLTEISKEREVLHQEIYMLRQKVREYEPNFNESFMNQVPKKTVMLFAFLLCVGVFFTFGTSTNTIKLDSLSANVGRVLLSVNSTSQVEEKVSVRRQGEFLEMAKESVMFQREMKNLFVPEKNETVKQSQSNQLVEVVEPTVKQPSLDKGFIFHYKNQEDTILFMCPKMYPIFPTTATATKPNVSMTILVPVESTTDGDQTIIKLSKFTAVEMEKTEAYLTL